MVFRGTSLSLSLLQDLGRCMVQWTFIRTLWSKWLTEINGWHTLVRRQCRCSLRLWKSVIGAYGLYRLLWGNHMTAGLSSGLSFCLTELIWRYARILWLMWLWDFKIICSGKVTGVESSFGTDVCDRGNLTNVVIYPKVNRGRIYGLILGTPAFEKSQKNLIFWPYMFVGVGNFWLF